jgi:hypothetical protein
MADVDDNEEAYLEMPEEHVKKIAMPDTVWAKIGDDGQLEVLRWDIIEMYAAEYDSLNKAKNPNKPQTHVLCKLLVLVRDETRKENRR